MQEIDKLGKIMEIIFEDCGRCPLERVCQGKCDFVWQEFFNSKVKKDGIETCGN